MPIKYNWALPGASVAAGSATSPSASRPSAIGEILAQISSALARNYAETGPTASHHEPSFAEAASITPSGDARAKLVAGRQGRHLPATFIVTEANAAAIRAIFEQKGELPAAVEL